MRSKIDKILVSKEDKDGTFKGCWFWRRISVIVTITANNQNVSMRKSVGCRLRVHRYVKPLIHSLPTLCYLRINIFYFA